MVWFGFEVVTVKKFMTTSASNDYGDVTEKWKKTLPKNGRRPHHKMADNITQKWKMNSAINRRQPKWKTTIMEDNQNFSRSIVNYHHTWG